MPNRVTPCVLDTCAYFGPTVNGRRAQERTAAPLGTKIARRFSAGADRNNTYQVPLGTEEAVVPAGLAWLLWPVQPAINGWAIFMNATGSWENQADGGGRRNVAGGPVGGRVGVGEPNRAETGAGSLLPTAIAEQ